MTRYLCIIMLGVVGSMMTSAACDEVCSPTQHRQDNFERFSASIDVLHHRKQEVSSQLKALKQHLEPSKEVILEKEKLTKQLSGLKKAIKKLLKQKKLLEDTTFGPNYPDLT